MIDQLIREKAQELTYNANEQNNINNSISHLKKIINNKPDYRGTFVGGSWTRNTAVKGISDVDIYFEYIGGETPQIALTKLKTYLKQVYEKANIKKDKPSLSIDFERIPFNITPYIKDSAQNTKIPSDDLKTWNTVNPALLEARVRQLCGKNEGYRSLIRVLKYWNNSHRKAERNFKIEERICNYFIPLNNASSSISHWMWLYFKNNNHAIDAIQMESIIAIKGNESQVRGAWKKFIENK